MTKDAERGRYTSPDGSATWEYISVMSCASLMLCCGCVTGWASPTLGILMDPNSPIMVTPPDASTLAAMPNAGQTLGSILTIVMMDKLGRRKSLLVSGIPLLTSWAMIAISKKIMVLFVARFISGLSFAFITCIVPLYVGELASANFRGAVGLLCGIMFTSGALLMFTVAPYLSIKVMACLCLGIATVTILSVWFIPDSPYFLTVVGKTDEAEDALMKLRGKTDVGEELELIKMTVSQKGRAKDRPLALEQLFTVSGNRKALAINFLFLIALHLGGYVLIALYSSLIFERMNTGVDPRVCMILLALIPLASKVAVAFVIDKLGRRPLIFVSGLVSGFSVFAVGIFFYLMEYVDMDVTPYGLFALGAIFVNAIAINVGLMPLQIVILSETLDNEVKALAACLAGVGGGIMGTVGAKAYLMITETQGFGHSVPFFGFAVITWSSMILILKMLPETKGKTLLDIQRALNA